MKNKIHTLPFMSDTLRDITNRFPELRKSIDEYVKTVVDRGEWETITSDIAYKPKNVFPRTITIKHICSSGKRSEKFVHSFTCSWKLE